MPVINNEVLHQGPRGSAVGKVGYNNEYHGAYNITLVFGNQKLVSWGSANLGEGPSIIILRMAPAQLNLRGGDSQLVVKLHDTGNILLGSQSDHRHRL